MRKMFVVAAALLIFAGSSYAGWLDDAVKGAVQGAGERGVNEAVDSGYEGTKSAGKKAMENDAKAPEQVAENDKGTSTESQAGDKAPGDMKEGKWKITVTMDMPGMPAGMSAQSYTSCLTKNSRVPQQEGNNQDCKFSEMKTTGNKVSWVATCKDERGGTAKSTGEITYRGSGFDGAMTTEVNDPEQGKIKMKNKMKGEYLGPCDK